MGVALKMKHVIVINLISGSYHSISRYCYFNIPFKQLCMSNKIEQLSYSNSNSIKELKNKAVLNLKQYYVHCYVVLSNVF